MKSNNTSTSYIRGLSTPPYPPSFCVPQEYSRLINKKYFNNQLMINALQNN